MVSVDNARAANLNGIDLKSALDVFHVTLDDFVIHD